jgi:hypothetical protein
MKSIFALALISFVLNSTAGDKKDKTPWKTIFNGKDFTNWKIVGSTGHAEVKDSAFWCHMTANTTEHTFVTTKEKYGDFILEMDVNTDLGYNTGILLRCADKPVDCDTCKVSLYGYQIKIDPSPTRRWTGGIFDDFGASWCWLYDLSKDERARKAYQIGQWNHFRVEAIGSSIKVWVNGIPTTNLVNQKYSAGYIALKIHSLKNQPEEEMKVGRFKNIRIMTKNLDKNLLEMDLMPLKVN